MASYAGQYWANVYNTVMQLPNGVTSSLQYVQDGAGNASALQVSSTTVNVQGTLTVNGSPLNGITALTGDVTASGTGSVAASVVKINGVALGTTTATSGNFLIGSGTAWVTNALSGAITCNSSGVTTLGSGVVGTIQLASNAVTTAKIASATILGSNIAASTVAYSNLVQTDITGLSNLVTVGTIGTGVWQGTLVGPTYGGTGVNNASNTITLGGNISTANSFTTSGNHPLTLTTTATTTATVPSGTVTLLASGGVAVQTVHRQVLNTGITTYTPTAGMLYCIVEMMGAGGSGGGSAITTSAQVSTGSGGGGGAYFKLLCTSAQIGSSCACTVGTIAGGSTASAGSSGGNTTFTPTLGTAWTAGGGSGGVVGAAAASLLNVPLGAAGGTLTNGTGAVILASNPGCSGGNGYPLAAGGAIGGQGGGGLYGQGAPISVIGSANGTTANISVPAYGAGGGGAASTVSNAAGQTGGASAPGVIIITEFCNA